MRLVDREQRDLQLLRKRAEAVGQQPLRRDVEDLVSAEARVAVGLAQLLDGHGAVDAAGRDAGVLQGHDLILHERDERRDDERQPRQQQGGQLIAKALAAARRHDAEHIAPGQDRVDKRLLPLPEGRKPKILPQHLHLLHPRTPFRRFSPLYHIRTGLQGKEKVAPLAARGAVSRGYKERTHLVGAGLCPARSSDEPGASGRSRAPPLQTAPQEGNIHQNFGCAFY